MLFCILHLGITKRNSQEFDMHFKLFQHNKVATRLKTKVAQIGKLRILSKMLNEISGLKINPCSKNNVKKITVIQLRQLANCLKWKKKWGLDNWNKVTIFFIISFPTSFSDILWKMKWYKIDCLCLSFTYCCVLTVGPRKGGDIIQWVHTPSHDAVVTQQARSHACSVVIQGQPWCEDVLWDPRY